MSDLYRLLSVVKESMDDEHTGYQQEVLRDVFTENSFGNITEKDTETVLSVLDGLLDVAIQRNAQYTTMLLITLLHML